LTTEDEVLDTSEVRAQKNDSEFLRSTLLQNFNFPITSQGYTSGFEDFSDQYRFFSI
jgi:hypothetical protein